MNIGLLPGRESLNSRCPCNLLSLLCNVGIQGHILRLKGGYSKTRVRKETAETGGTMLVLPAWELVPWIMMGFMSRRFVLRSPAPPTSGRLAGNILYPS